MVHFLFLRGVMPLNARANTFDSVLWPRRPLPGLRGEFRFRDPTIAGADVGRQQPIFTQAPTILVTVGILLTAYSVMREILALWY